jgi:hypothetical protein
MSDLGQGQEDFQRQELRQIQTGSEDSRGWESFTDTILEGKVDQFWFPGDEYPQGDRPEEDFR